MPQTYPLGENSKYSIMAHIDAENTTTAERILFYTVRCLQNRCSGGGINHRSLD